MKEIVLSQKIERDELLKGRYVQREGLKSARESLQGNLFKVIIGPRRAGKSVFSIQMLEGVNFAYLNFDDERLVSASDYDELLKAIRQVYGETKLVLFDEIQNLPKWELFINGLHRRGFNVILTGSNAYLLSRELSTHLTGRYIQFQIFPFSFLEFLRAKEFAMDQALELKERQGSLLSHLDGYLDKGGYPEIVVKDLDVKNYLTPEPFPVLYNGPTKSYNNTNEYFQCEGVLMMNVSEAIAKRKSVRAYEDKPIPADVLKRIVEAGQWAPNAGPFQISVIQNTGLRQRINDRALDAMVHSGNEFAKQRASLPGYQPIYGAPVLILLSAPADAPFGTANTALAAENMLLEATGLGLGSCYLVSPTRALNGESNHDLAREAGVPKGYTVQCAVIVGYAAAENKFSVGERSKRGNINYVE